MSWTLVRLGSSSAGRRNFVLNPQFRLLRIGLPKNCLSPHRRNSISLAYNAPYNRAAALPSLSFALDSQQLKPYARRGRNNFVTAYYGTMNLGYACDNFALRKSRGVYTSRSCHRRTFDSQGLAHISHLALQNCRNLVQVLQWNDAHGIKLFRVSSKLFPWSGQYTLEALPDFEDIAEALAIAGKFALHSGHRLTAHPPHFIKLAATDESIRRRSIADLEIQSQVFDLMGLPRSHWSKINIHVGGTYGNKTRTLERFARTFETLSESTRSRLTVENDDRPTSYSVSDLMQLHRMSGIPITFDFFHHQFCPGGMSQLDAFESALMTWPRDVKPVVHWSEPPECPKRRQTHPYRHSTFVYGPINLYGRDCDVDVMIESKAKEVALLMYRDELAPRYAEETTAQCEVLMAAA